MMVYIGYTYIFVVYFSVYFRDVCHVEHLKVKSDRLVVISQKNKIHISRNVPCSEL